MERVHDSGETTAAGPAMALLFGSPWIVALTTGAIALVTVWLKLARHAFNPRVFVHDTMDGVFVYRLALTYPSLNAELDAAAYRAQRILLPALAAPFRVGGAAGVEWAIIGINLVALVGGSYALARLAERHQVTPWLGCGFGLWLGSLYALHLDLTEVLAYALVLGAILAWEEDRRVRAGAFLGLAVLAKETALLYVLACLLAVVEWRRHPGGPRRQVIRDWLAFGALAIVPFLLWQGVLYFTFGIDGVRQLWAQNRPENRMMPFVGLLLRDSLNYELQLLLVLMPALVSIGWGTWRLWHGALAADGWALVLNGLFLVSLPAASTLSLAISARLVLGVVVALAWTAARMETRRGAVVLTDFLVLSATAFRVDWYL